MRFLLVLAIGVVATACYSPSYGDCSVTCANGVCPAGLTCTPEGVCREPGVTGPCQAPDARPDAGRTQLPIDELEAAQSEALCGFLVRCGAESDLANCVANFGAATSQGDLDDRIAAVKAGTLRYDEAQALACIASFTQQACTRDAFSGREPDACRGVFTGTIGAFGECAFDAQCVSGLCEKSTNCPPDTCCRGACLGDTPPADRSVGAGCTRADRCIDSYCDSSLASNPACVALKTVNEGCASSLECEVGLYCSYTGTQATCQARVDTNGPCSTNDACRLLSNVCNDGACEEGGLEGDACGTSPSPGATGCQPFYFCLSGTCTALPEAGESCQNVPLCRADAYCLNGTCAAKKPDGAQCDPSTFSGKDCEGGLCTPNFQCASEPPCI